MMRRTLALALTRAAGRPIPATMADAATEAGRVRARQRLPLPALLHAFRIDLRILWEAVIDEGRKIGLSANKSFVESSVLFPRVDIIVQDREGSRRHANLGVRDGPTQPGERGRQLVEQPGSSAGRRARHALAFEGRGWRQSAVGGPPFG